MMAALGFPYSLVYPPNSGNGQGSRKWHHPMERVTDLFFEAEMVMEKFHLPFHEWLKYPKEVRIFQMLVYRLHCEKENYWNTPKEKRFNYFNRE